MSIIPLPFDAPDSDAQFTIVTEPDGYVHVWLQMISTFPTPPDECSESFIIGTGPTELLALEEALATLDAGREKLRRRIETTVRTEAH